MPVVDEIFRKKVLTALESGEWWYSLDKEHVVVPVRAISASRTETAFLKVIVKTQGLGRYGVTTRHDKRLRVFFFNIKKLKELDERFAEFFAKIKQEEKESAPGAGVDNMPMDHLNAVTEVILNE